MTASPDTAHAVPFDEIALGQQATLVRTFTWRDIEPFSTLVGDAVPAAAEASRAHELVAHGIWGSALITTLLATRLPGPGTVYLSQELKFLGPIVLGDTVTATITVIEIDPARRRVLLDCRCVDQEDAEVIAGRAWVVAPQGTVVD